MALSTSQPTIVLLRALGLGDFCTGVPSFRAVRRAFPDHRLVLVAPRWQAPVARSVGIDEISDSAPLEPICAALDGAALAVNLHGRGPESTRLLNARHPLRLIAFRHSNVAETADGPHWRADEHDIDRWCRLLNESGIDADRDDFRLPAPAGVSPVAPGTVVVHPGSAAVGRRWPPERFASVVRTIVDARYRVAVTGSGGERELCHYVSDRSGRDVANLAGRTTVAELAAAVAAATAVITNDTGVAHLASAYGTPSVVLFGPTAPSAWGPPANGPHRVLWKGIGGDPHAAQTHPGLGQIEVSEVLDAFESLANLEWRAV